MAKAYSLDLRQKVLESLKTNKREDVMNIFKISESTIYRYLRLEKQGTIESRKRVFFKTKIEPKIVLDYVNDNPDQTLSEVGKAVNLCRSSVCKYLKRHNITRKKKQLFTKNHAI